MIRIDVDSSRCEGHGLCEGIAPDVFALHDEGSVEVLIEGRLVGEDFTAAVTEAERACPVAAIRLTDRPRPGK